MSLKQKVGFGFLTVCLLGLLQIFVQDAQKVLFADPLLQESTIVQGRASEDDLWGTTVPADREFVKTYIARTWPGGFPNVVSRPSGLHYVALRNGLADAQRAAPGLRCRFRVRVLRPEAPRAANEAARTADAVELEGRPGLLPAGRGEALALMREGDAWEVLLPGRLAASEGLELPPGAAALLELELLNVLSRPGGFFASIEDWVRGWVLWGVDYGKSWLQWAGLLEWCEWAWIVGWEYKWYILIFSIVSGCSMFWAAYAWFYWPVELQGPVLELESVCAPDNPVCYLDIHIRGLRAGRIEVELFPQVAPAAAENFRQLCTGEAGLCKKTGLQKCYAGTEMHRIIPNFMAQGGDWHGAKGRGGTSIYGGFFDDEWKDGVVKHTQRGLLSMANSGRNRNASQFFITFKETPHLDGKHVVFGRVTSGMEVLDLMEAVGTSHGTPRADVLIYACGMA